MKKETKLHETHFNVTSLTIPFWGEHEAKNGMIERVTGFRKSALTSINKLGFFLQTHRDFVSENFFLATTFLSKEEIECGKDTFRNMLR